MQTLPFVDCSGKPEHARPVHYTPYHSLEDLERHAWAANDHATLCVIDLAEEAAGIAAERIREHRAELLCDARGVTTMRAEMAELVKRTHAAEERARKADRLWSMVHFVLRPYTRHDAKAPPKWAEHLLRIVRELQREVQP